MKKESRKVVKETEDILLLKRIADLCDQAGDEIVDNEDTHEILNMCDMLCEKIDAYAGKSQ